MDRSQPVGKRGDRVWDDGVIRAGLSIVVTDALSGDGTSRNWSKLAADLGGGVESEAIAVVGDDRRIGAGAAARLHDGEQSNPCVELSASRFFDLKTSETTVFAGRFYFRGAGHVWDGSGG